jgi:hypothetical protein
VRIRIGELRDLNRDPEAWARTRRQAVSGKIFRLGYDRVLALGIHKFHKTGSKVSGHRHLEHLSIRAGLKNRNRLDGNYERFESYCAWCEAEQPVVIESNAKIGVDVGGVRLGGTYSRADLVPSGIRAILLGDAPADWRSEPRFPLLQKGVANRYAKAIEQIEVGVQQLDGSEIEVISFSDRDIDQAEERLTQLLARALPILGPV